ncbi:Base plate wedge protein 53 [Microbulbifer donghaiensis]|uniref:Base plate wedge protein 53 n=1 Tax=Microbulbifer donghaiensis TaxID=494016 RepID=A0A1M5CZC4_9GAMM|nr:baseplate wedge protein 53 [Microbulbifer donghaiensis]SHF60046.1 Base plate wedge protein 53 [Microbulbifer donghaiensis]
MDEEFAPKASELSQSYREGEVSVHIDIYEDGEGGWLLEVVDDNNNSTVWEDSFDTEEEALEEALDALRDEGIETFVGPVQETDESW